MNHLGEKLLDHYKEYLGDFIGADPYHDGEHQIQLLGFDRAVENCLLFATLGLSNYSESINNCCEVIMATDCDYEQCAKAFMNAIFYAVSNQMNFGRGVLIDGADHVVEGFSEKHNKTAIYFTEVYILPEDFSIVGDICKMYMGFFISKNEVEYIKKYGCEKFEDLLEQNNVDVIALDRASVVKKQFHGDLA